MMETQTIAAIATPSGEGGIAVIRLSGAACYSIAEKVFEPVNKNRSLKSLAGYTAAFGSFIWKGNKIDEGIALCFRAPHSYTGEDVVELSCHGGEEVSREVLQACIEAGAVPAAAGEFTKRAVLNGRISLTQAEAVMDMISASSRQGVVAAKAAMSGALFTEIAAQKSKLIEVASHLVAYTDYPEEDVEELTTENFSNTLGEVASVLKGLIDGFDRGSMLRRGVQTAIIGSPNVGKSTLFNLLAGQDRAIVTSVAGTTRDVLREQVQVGGVLLHLADTAGLRDTEDIVEAEGIKRSYHEIETASLIIAVLDGSQALTKAEWEMIRLCKDRPAVAIVNKSDLGTVIDIEEIDSYFRKIVVGSAKEEITRKNVEESVLSVLRLDKIDPNAAMLANERQLSAVQVAYDALVEGQNALQLGLTIDAAGVCLDDALSALSALTGENATETVISEVFERFCVGK